MARKGQFRKGGGRHGDTAIARRPTPKAPAKRATRAPAKHKPRRHRRHGHRTGGVEGLAKLAIAGLGLAAIVGANSKLAPSGSGIRNLVDKIPGNKTVGPVAIVGLAAGAVDRWFWRNRWLRLAGIIGVAATAINIGEKLGSGQEIKWLGDDDGGSDNFDDDDRGGFGVDVR